MTLKEKVSYTYITHDGKEAAGYFPTYEQARETAKWDQPWYRPYYIVERTEHFEICGRVGGKKH